MITSLFVYGTLKQGHLRGGMWPAPALTIQPAVARGALYDLGPYPGMTEGDDWVLGELWTLAPEDIEPTLRVLDGIEGYDASTDSGPYLRRIIEVQVASHSASGDAVRNEAYTYRIADPSRVAAARRIHATNQWHALSVAQWPDAIARVPLRLDEE